MVYTKPGILKGLNGCHQSRRISFGRVWYIQPYSGYSVCYFNTLRLRIVKI
jgi:hypothetical protein